jgi:hypothetical protein
MGEREEPATDADLSPIPFSLEEQAEFDEWDKLSDEAWAMIDWGDPNEPVAVRGGSDGD